MRALELRQVTAIGDLPAPSNAALDFIEAWKSVRHGRLVPLKQDFDPLLVPSLLPHLWIYQYDSQEAVFTCRLAGEMINQAWGHRITGKRSNQIFGRDDNETVVGIWRQILDVPLIHYGKQERLARNRLYAAERVVVPLADDTGERRFILGLSLYVLGGKARYSPPAFLKSAYHILCRDL